VAKSQQKEQPVDEHHNIDLRGTLVSSMLLGAFLIVTWLGVWYIFISR